MTSAFAQQQQTALDGIALAVGSLQARSPYHLVGFDIMGVPIYATAAQLQQLGLHLPPSCAAQPSVLPFSRESFGSYYQGPMPDAAPGGGSSSWDRAPANTSS